VTAVLLCTGRGAHDPAVVAILGHPDDVWVPARRPGGAHEERCGECGRRWRLGARRFRALSEAVRAGRLSGRIDLSMLT
jgi:hypothetical protein